MHYDIIVLGLGAHGSSAIYHLSKKGLRVAGIDRFAPPHTHGSSHGQTRIIRQAYYESPLYVPLLKAAYSEWNKMEKTAGQQLFLKTGGLMLGHAESAVVKGAKLSAETHGIAFEYLDQQAIIKRFPAFCAPKDTVAVLENEAGILFPEKCIQAFLEQAAKNGATLQLNEQVTAIETNDGFVKLVTDKATYRTSKLIVSAGAWLQQLLPGLHLPLTVNRQVLYWFRNNGSNNSFFTPEHFPVYIWEHEPGKMFYGFPDMGEGIKIAPHHAGHSIHPDALTDDVSEAEINGMLSITDSFFNIQPVFNYSATCMYTNTPDEHFIMDEHPQHKNIIVASPCSGHGFKFSSLTGKLLADMATGSSIPFDLSPFSISRFSQKKPG